jgi:hypothetical protein
MKNNEKLKRHSNEVTLRLFTPSTINNSSPIEDFACYFESAKMLGNGFGKMCIRMSKVPGS